MSLSLRRTWALVAFFALALASIATSPTNPGVTTSWFGTIELDAEHPRATRALTATLDTGPNALIFDGGPTLTASAVLTWSTSLRPTGAGGDDSSPAVDVWLGDGGTSLPLFLDCPPGNRCTQELEATFALRPGETRATTISAQVTAHVEAGSLGSTGGTQFTLTSP